MKLTIRIILLISHILLFAICADELMKYMSENYPLWVISLLIVLLSILVITSIYHIKTFIKYLKNNS